MDDVVQPWADWLVAFSTTVEKIHAETVLQHINEDRRVAGFPDVTITELVESELSERRNAYRTAVHAWLDRLESTDLLKALTDAVHLATSSGTRHPPRLIEEVVLDYELSAQPALAKAEETVGKLIEAARNSAPGGELSITPTLDEIRNTVLHWDRIAKPAQLCAKSRGEEHAPSQRLAYAIRSLGVDLANDHAYYASSTTLTKLLQDFFAEVPDVAARVSEDASTLEGLIEKAKSQAQEHTEFADELRYSTEVGLVIKTRLSISVDGIVWGTKHYRLEDITRARWGAIRRSVNFIPTGTDYYVSFGSPDELTNVQTRRSDVYQNFTSRLYRATCISIMVGYARRLRNGDGVAFGDILLFDDGCEIALHKFIGSERVRSTWSDLNVWSSDGSFFVGMKSNKKAHSSASYKDDDNTHFLEAMIRFFFKDPNSTRISDSFLT